MQLITNHDELHEYAAGKVVEGLRRGAAGDALLGAAAYLLGAALGQCMGHDHRSGIPKAYCLGQAAKLPARVRRKHIDRDTAAFAGTSMCSSHDVARVCSALALCVSSVCYSFERHEHCFL